MGGKERNLYKDIKKEIITEKKILTLLKPQYIWTMQICLIFVPGASQENSDRLLIGFDFQRTFLEFSVKVAR